jgi:hypothetical protein
MDQLEAYVRTSSESGDSEEASENENSAEDESIATGELVGEEHDEEEMEANDSAGDEGPPVARHTARSARDAMMERLDRLANDFKATVQALKSGGKGMARRISPTKLAAKRPRGTRSPSMGSDAFEDDDMDRDSLTSFGSHTPRKKILAEWLQVVTLMKTDHNRVTAMEVFKTLAEEDLAKSGPLEDIHPKQKDLGGFKVNRVRSCEFDISQFAISHV